MTLDDVFKPTISAILGAIGFVVTWVVTKVLKNREDNVVQSEQIKTLEAKLQSLEGHQLTVEKVREVVEDSLNKRDKIAAERRVEWDKLLSLELRAAVQEGQLQTKKELENLVKNLVPPIVEEVCRRTRRHRREFPDGD